MPPPAPYLPRWAFPLALVLGTAAGFLCWIRVEPPRPLRVDCRVEEVERTRERIVYRAEFVTDFVQDLLVVRPESEWVRWDPDASDRVAEGRRIRGRITVGLPGGALEPRPGLLLLVNGRPLRRVELPR